MNFIKLFQGRYHLRADGSTTFFLQRNEFFESVSDNHGKSPKKRILEEFRVSPDIVFLSVVHVLAILVPVFTCLCK